MINKKDLITSRTAREGDMNFIFSTFLRGLYYGNEWYGRIKAEIYYTHYHRVLERLLAKKGCTILISCLKEDPDTIIGYSIFEPEILHYVFVKPIWRKIGIARDLIPENTASYTHLTKQGIQLQKKYPNTIFNPFNI